MREGLGWRLELGAGRGIRGGRGMGEWVREERSTLWGRARRADPFHRCVQRGLFTSRTDKETFFEAWHTAPGDLGPQSFALEGAPPFEPVRV